MLTFRRLKAENFCQHRKLDVTFSPGVVGILGRNGSGKSNLVKGLFRALTGKSLNPGRKEDDLTWGAESGLLELDFTINGKDATIVRDLKTERCSLSIAGEEKIRKAKEIERRLYPFLGVSPRVLADVVFVMQGRIEGILFQEPAERMKSFQHLFGTQNAERIRDLVQDELTNLNVESREDQIRQFKRRLETEVEPPLTEALKTIESCNAFRLSDEQRGRIEKQLDLHRRAEFSIDRLKDARLAFERTDGEVKGAEETIRRWLVKVDEAENLLDELKPAIERAERVVDAARNAEEVASRRALLEKDEAYCRGVMDRPEPACDVSERDVEEARTRLSGLEGEYAQYHKLVAAGKGLAGARNACPTCGQEISEEHVLEAKLKVDRMAKPLEELRAAVRAAAGTLLTYRESLATFSANRAAAEKQLESVKAGLAALPAVVEVDPAEVAEAREVLVQAASLEQRVEETKIQLRVAQDTLKALESARRERSTELQVLEADVARDPGKEAVSGAQEALNKDMQARLAIERAEGTKDSLQKQKDSMLAQLTQWEVEEARLSRMRQWREHLENVRRLLHRDALPGEVARMYMDALNGRLGHYLGLFGSPFAAEISSDATVTCRFTDKPEMPSERLSGGQKVILGVAFRFAVYDLFVADLGVMILDEPTVYLDDINVSAVAELLNHLKLYSRSAGVQLFVVTHALELSGSFDQECSLGS